jgi:hypothetical protein
VRKRAATAEVARNVVGGEVVEVDGEHEVTNLRIYKLSDWDCQLNNHFVNS